MIVINFAIQRLTSFKFENFWCRTWSTPFNNKYVELEYFTSENLIGVNFNWTIRGDHAGVDIELSLLGHAVHFNFYDNRHWDYEKNTFGTHLN